MRLLITQFFLESMCAKSNHVSFTYLSKIIEFAKVYEPFICNLSQSQCNYSSCHSDCRWHQNLQRNTDRFNLFNLNSIEKTHSAEATKNPIWTRFAVRRNCKPFSILAMENFLFRSRNKQCAFMNWFLLAFFVHWRDENSVFFIKAFCDL